MLGIVFHYFDGTAVIHFETCHWYQTALHTHLPLTAKVRIRFCRCCRPVPEDVLADPPAVRWYEWGHDLAAKVVSMDLDFAEKLAVRRELGIGKRNTSGREWEG